MIHAEQTKDLERVRRVLLHDPIATAYMLGDLDPLYSHSCTWWISSDDGKDVAVLLVYNGLSAPVVITHGAPEGIELIASTKLEDLPWRGHVHLSPDHLEAMQAAFSFDRMRLMMRMGIDVENLVREVPRPGHDYAPITRLGHRDTGDIVALSAFYPDSFFEPHQLSTGHYYGVRTVGRDGQAGELVSVAGVHIVSRVDRIAALGNIVTHPEHRGRGLSTACTAFLAGALADEGMRLLVLNVQRENADARRVYEKLGFREHCTYLEGFLVRALEAGR